MVGEWIICLGLGFGIGFLLATWLRMGKPITVGRLVVDLTDWDADRYRIDILEPLVDLADYKEVCLNVEQAHIEPFEDRGGNNRFNDTSD